MDSSIYVASGNFSPSEPNFSSHFSCKNPVSACSQASNGGKTFNPSHMILNNLQCDHQVNAASPSADFSFSAENLPLKAVPSEMLDSCNGNLLEACPQACPHASASANLFQVGAQLLNTCPRVPTMDSSIYVASGNFSPSEPNFSSHFSCKNPVSACSQASNGGKTFSPSHMILNNLQCDHQVNAASPSADFSFSAENLPFKAVPSEIISTPAQVISPGNSLHAGHSVFTATSPVQQVIPSSVETVVPCTLKSLDKEGCSSSNGLPSSSSLFTQKNHPPCNNYSVGNHNVSCWKVTIHTQPKQDETTAISAFSTQLSTVFLKLLAPSVLNLLLEVHTVLDRFLLLVFMFCCSFGTFSSESFTNSSHSFGQIPAACCYVLLQFWAQSARQFVVAFLAAIFCCYSSFYFL
ncbi:hypothetical protein LguiB_020475 [Lonicera macranthoides]